MIDTAAGGVVLPVVTMAFLAVLLSICSEADAFVATGMPQFARCASRLVFLVVGPMVLIDALQAARAAGTAAVFAPVTLVVAVVCATVHGRGAAVNRLGRVPVLGGMGVRALGSY